MRQANRLHKKPFAKPLKAYSMDRRHTTVLALACSLLAACASLSQQDQAGNAIEATAKSYATSRQDKGIVLLDVNWGRRWGCGDWQNAQIQGVGFDRVTPPRKQATNTPDIDLQGKPGWFGDQYHWVSYALLVEPGVYTLSDINIKVAANVQTVGFLHVTRDKLQQIGMEKVGHFDVAANETVYIGSFALDCAQGPMLWRYYMPAETIRSSTSSFAGKYPFLDMNKVAYRLFKSQIIANPDPVAAKPRRKGQSARVQQ